MRGDPSRYGNLLYESASSPRTSDHRAVHAAHLVRLAQPLNLTSKTAISEDVRERISLAARMGVMVRNVCTFLSVEEACALTKVGAEWREFVWESRGMLKAIGAAEMSVWAEYIVRGVVAVHRLANSSAALSVAHPAGDRDVQARITAARKPLMSRRAKLEQDRRSLEPLAHQLRNQVLPIAKKEQM